MSENSEERPPPFAKPEPDIPEPKPSAEDGDWLRLSALAPELPSSSFPRDQPTMPLPVAPISCSSRETRVESVPTIPGYQILGVLGRGGMGLVYQALQIDLNRIVALKMIRTGGDPAAEIARFREEALAVAALCHPNIIGIFAIDQFNDTPFFTMEYAEGGSLARSAAHQPQPPDYAAELVQTLALAVQAAHDQGIVHRDLKPANVLLDRSGRPKVSDFGAAKRIDSDSHPTETGQILGTPSYMSPEQAGGKRDQIGPLTDVYSLGAILYELLTGRPPFQATEALLTINQVLTAEPIPPSRIHAGIPRDLETICLKCLRKLPAERYSSASALADDLQRFRDGKPILARRISRLERAARWVRRKPREAAVVAGIVVLLIIISGSMIWNASAKSVHHSRLAVQVQDAFHEAELRYAVARVAADGETEPWTEARAAARRTADLLSSVDDLPAWRNRVRELVAAVEQGENSARQRAARIAQERVIKSRLTAIRLNSGRQHGNTITMGDRDEQYRQLFREVGVDLATLSPEEVLDRIARGPLREDLEAAYLEWAFLIIRSKDPSANGQRGALKILTGRDPNAWRRKLWTAFAARDAAAVAALIGQLDAQTQPPTIHFVAARLLVEMGFRTEAVAVLTAAQRLHPADFFIAHELAWELQHLDRPRLDEAIGYYRVAMALRPDLPGVWTNLGRALSAKGEHDEAVRWHRRVIEAQPEEPHGFCNLGFALTAQGKFPEALIEFRKSLERDPKLAEAWGGLAKVFVQQGRYDEAIEALRTITRDHPADATGFYELGNVYLIKKQFADAQTAFSRAVEIDPNDAWSHNDLGMAYRQQGKWDAAVPCVQEAVALAPNEPRFSFNLGLLQFHLGHWNDAIAAFTAAAQKQPTDPRPFVQMGNAWTRLSEPAKAEKSYRNAARIKPGDAPSILALATFLFENQRAEEAIPWFRQAISIRDDFAEAHCNLGLALLRTGKYEEARDQLRRGHELGSSHPGWTYPSAAWLKQAEDLVVLDQQLADYLNSPRPALPLADLAKFARFCVAEKQFYVLATEFHRELARINPATEKNPREQMLFRFAWVSAQAGCGKGNDAATLPAAERSRLRLLGLEWINDSLKAWEKVVEQNANERIAMVIALTAWKAGPELACVRDAMALAHLPEDDQKAWLQFWKHVDQIIAH